MNTKAQTMGNRLSLRYWKMICVVLYAVFFFACWKLFYADKMATAYGWRGDLFLLLVYGLFMTYFIRVYDGLNFDMTRFSETVYSQSLATLVCNAFTYVLMIFLFEGFENPVPLIALQISQITAGIAWTRIANRLNTKMAHVETAAIVYRNERDLKKILAIPYLREKYAIQRIIEAPKNSKEAIERLQGIRVVFIAGISATTRNGILKHCLAEEKRAYVLPKTGDILMKGAKTHHVTGELLMEVHRSSPSPEYLAIKRGFDVAASLLAILIASPFMLIIAAAIKLHDRGPVLYKQVRLTRNGRKYAMWKFRSMRVDAERDGVARLAAGNDERITPIGRFIRACRLDELPQLFNILGGSMTIVGPRPERPEIAAQYEEMLPEFALRLQVKAGLTGYAQIYGRYNSEPYEKLQMDLTYINEMSVAEDLKLMLATVKVLFMKESTEGVKTGQTIAIHTEGNRESA